ncbi:MAG TPA: carboxypeptidase regulatory-like domain-containing protein, partial [Polyangiaceae bacterium]
AATRGTITGTVVSMPPSAAKNAVIYLEDGPTDKVVNVSIDNQQMTFSPYVAVATVGGAVTFVNSDPFPHNIFSPDGEKWDLGQIAQHGSKTKKFEKEASYVLLCNMHPNMKGYLLVVPSSVYAKADGKGGYSLKDVPAGTYKITAWAPGVKPVTQSVTVAGDVSSSFELKR